MEQSLILRHRLKLFIGCLLLAGLIGGLFAKSKMNALLNTVVAENEGVGFGMMNATLSELGAIVEAETELGSTDRAEGYRYALRQAAQWQALFYTEFNDSMPSISRCPSRPCKYGFDNPDTVYVMIGPLSASHNYLLTGQVGTVPYTTYQVFGIGTGKGFATGGTLEDNQINYNEDGSFEILIATQNPDGHPNFIEMPEGRGGQLLIRQLVRDWNKDTENAYRIEAIGEFKTPNILSQAAFDKRSIGMTRFLKGQFMEWRNRIKTAPANTIEHGKADRADGGFPTNFTSYGRYKLKDGQVLILEVPKIDIVYGNIQMSNLWAESLNYPSRTTSFNDFQAYTDTDGVTRYVVAMEDPGVPNWLDATGHREGGLFMRWQSPQSEVPEPQAKLLKLSDLRDHLPDDHPEFSQSDREVQLRQRHAGFLRRQSPVYFD